MPKYVPGVRGQHVDAHRTGVVAVDPVLGAAQRTQESGVHSRPARVGRREGPQPPRWR